MSVISRDLSEQMADAYRELRLRRDRGEGADGMRAHVSGLNGALTDDERAALERWISAEEHEPTRPRRWMVSAGVGGGHRLVPVVVRELRRDMAARDGRVGTEAAVSVAVSPPDATPAM